MQKVIFDRRYGSWYAPKVPRFTGEHAICLIERSRPVAGSSVAGALEPVAKKTGKKTRGSGQVSQKPSKGSKTVPINIQIDRQKPPSYQLSSRKWLLLVALTSVLGLVLGASMIFLNLLSISRTYTVPTITGRDPVGVERRTKGDPNAPVVITEWFDYQCSACARVALNRDPILERLYADSGKVRFVYKNMPFLGQESFWAAEAAECAADQGRYWDYRNLLFQRQQSENLGGFSIANLKAFAAELGLDQATFNACFDQGKHRAAIQKEAQEGDQLGLEATPTFFINGRMIDGIPSVEAFQKLIEEELAKK